jgi:hypothetical protein
MEANLRRILEEQQRQSSSAGASDSEQSARSASQSEQQSLLAQGQQLLQMSQRQLTQQALPPPRLPQLDLPPPKQRKGRGGGEPGAEPPRSKRRKHDGQAFPQGEMPAMPSERARAIANGSWGPQLRLPKMVPPQAPQQGVYSPRGRAEQMPAPQYAPPYGSVQVQQQGSALPQHGWPAVQHAQGQMPTPGFGSSGGEGQAPYAAAYDSPRHRHGEGGRPGVSEPGDGLARRQSQAVLAQEGVASGSLQPAAPYDGVGHGPQMQAPPDPPRGSAPGPTLETPSEFGDGSEGQGDMWAQREVHLWLNDSDQGPPSQWEDGGTATGSGGSDGLGNRRRALRANA